MSTLTRRAAASGLLALGVLAGSSVHAMAAAPGVTASCFSAAGESNPSDSDDVAVVAESESAVTGKPGRGPLIRSGTAILALTERSAGFPPCRAEPKTAVSDETFRPHPRAVIDFDADQSAAHAHSNADPRHLDFDETASQEPTVAEPDSALGVDPAIDPGSTDDASAGDLIAQQKPAGPEPHSLRGNQSASRQEHLADLDARGHSVISAGEGVSTFALNIRQRPRSVVHAQPAPRSDPQSSPLAVADIAAVSLVAASRVTADAIGIATEFGRLGNGWAGAIVFNLWLRRQLRERRMSQRQLAHRSGVNHSTISRLLRGDRTPSLDTAARLVRAVQTIPHDDDVVRYLDGLTSSTALPTRRVEAALRGDEDLDDEDVDRLMREYLATRVKARARRLGA